MKSNVEQVFSLIKTGQGCNPGVPPFLPTLLDAIPADDFVNAGQNLVQAAVDAYHKFNSIEQLVVVLQYSANTKNLNLINQLFNNIDQKTFLSTFIHHPRVIQSFLTLQLPLDAGLVLHLHGKFNNSNTKQLVERVTSETTNDAWPVMLKQAIEAGDEIIFNEALKLIKANRIDVTFERNPIEILYSNKNLSDSQRYRMTKALMDNFSLVIPHSCLQAPSAIDDDGVERSTDGLLQELQAQRDKKAHKDCMQLFEDKFVNGENFEVTPAQRKTFLLSTRGLTYQAMTTARPEQLQEYLQAVEPERLEKWTTMLETKIAEMEEEINTLNTRIYRRKYYYAPGALLAAAGGAVGTISSLLHMLTQGDSDSSSDSDSSAEAIDAMVLLLLPSMCISVGCFLLSSNISTKKLEEKLEPLENQLPILKQRLSLLKGYDVTAEMDTDLESGPSSSSESAALLPMSRPGGYGAIN